MILALDYGQRYVGVAITDEEQRLALRHAVIDRKSDDAVARVAEIAREKAVRKVLVGLPISLSGEEHAQAHITRAFVQRLETALRDSEVVLVDERFTSKEAERRTAAEGLSSKESHAEAARLLLFDYLRTKSL